MTTQQKLDYVEKYLERYFDKMLIKDIELIRNEDLHFTFPYILLVSTGIDFLGGLKEGFGDNTSKRSCYFIEKWLGRVNDLYSDERMSRIIYKSVRCGASHQAIYKKEIESTSWIYPRDNHLNHMIDLSGKDRILIHALQFVEDFLEAQKLFRREYINQNIDGVWENLNKMLLEKEDKDFFNLIEDLKKMNLTFEAEKTIQNNPRVKIYDRNTKIIIGTDYEQAVPSAAPPGTN